MANDSAKQPLLSGLLDPTPQTNKKVAPNRRRFRRARSAPLAEYVPSEIDGHANGSIPRSPSIFDKLHPSFKKVSLFLAVYLGAGATCFYLVRNQIAGVKSNGILDAVYLCIVTMTTVGYGDLVPNSVPTKLLACAFVFSGMVIVGLVLSKAADYLVEKQEILLVKALHMRKRIGQTDILKEIEINRVRYKCFMVFAFLLVLIVVGTTFLVTVEKLDVVDAFYCVCCTVTTLGYGDKSFSTKAGRVFAVFWILMSTLCLASRSHANPPVPSLLLLPTHRRPKSLPKPLHLNAKPFLLQFLPKILHLRRNFAVNSYASDEFPVDEAFLEQFGPKEKESEDEARRRNWIERGWAPWEEILTPEADFARKSLNEGEEVPLQTPEAIEAFRMLSPKYRKKKMEEMGLTEDEWYAKQFEIKGEISEPLQTAWAAPLVVRHVPPRDWPPRGWEVDREELEFIREAHKLVPTRVDLEQVEKEAVTNTDDLCLERYKVFLKQYNEWVAANKGRLEEESYQYDQDYYPGRRKRGKDYEEGMYELPFYYPGQICAGKVTTLHLYQGAFVDIGGVHDGWVPIKRNDWYWIRHHIKVGMHVVVEILAKRDPYRFRFPIEMRFVDPNIDHLIFNRFDFPPIFHRDEDTNPDEIRRDCGRPPIPRKDPGDNPVEVPLLSNHPYVDKLWQIHVAEQMILDDMEANPDKYKDKKLSELSDDEDFDEENSVEYTKAYYKKTLLPKVILKQSVKELDLEAALAERELHNKLREEAKERGEKYKVTKLRRNIEMDEYDFIHWRRSLEEREALIRDISCRQSLGLPLEEPGRYVDASYFGKDQYDPSNPLYRYDYWGEPKNSEKSRQERMTDAHNKSIVGKGTVWYEMSYEEAIKQQMQRESQSKGVLPKEVDSEEERDHDDDHDDDDDDDDFDYSILGDPSMSFSNQPVVNGTESSRMSDDKGMFEN